MKCINSQILFLFTFIFCFLIEKIARGMKPPVLSLFSGTHLWVDRFFGSTLLSKEANDAFYVQYIIETSGSTLEKSVVS